MWKKFKELKTLPKIIVGIIAFIFMPITFMLLAIEFFIKSIKNKKVFGSIVGLILSVILIFFNVTTVIAVFTPTDPEVLATMEAEQKAKEEQEAREKAEAEQKAKEEQEAKKKAEAEQKAKEEQEAKKKAEAEQKAKKEQKSKKKFEYTSIGTPTERPVMNGTKTERIGTYLDAVCNNTTLTDKELIQFYKDYVKDKNYNWVQLRFSDGTGLHFSGNYFTYCTLDVENGISNEKGNGVIYADSNKVEYDGKDYTK